MGRGPGWFNEPYRHALAARGITLKSREELDYALTKRGEIYPGEMAQYVWYAVYDDYCYYLQDYEPATGEIQSLKNIKLMMEIYDRRRHRPLNRDEIAILRSLVKDFMRRVKRTDVWETKMSEYEMLDDFLTGELSENEGRSALFATETVLFLMHHNRNSIDVYLGREPYDRSISSKVVQVALDLQRGGYGEIPPGDAEVLLDIWIQELEGRRYM